MEKDKEVSFVGVTVYNRSRIIIPAVIDEYEEQEKDHAIVFYRIENKWYHQLVDSSVRSVVCIQEEGKIHQLLLGIEGKVYDASSSGTVVENIDTSNEGPNKLVPLLSIRTIDSRIYAAGMARRVYVRESPGTWGRIDEGVYVPRSENIQTVGFYSIDGLNEKDIYAVGLKGEIWHFDGATWQKEKTFERGWLNCLRCFDENNIFACGQGGLLLQKTGGEWKVLDQKATKNDLSGIAYFKDKIYVAGRDGVFVWNGNDLEKVDMKLKKSVTTGHIDANDGVMWSVGEKDLVMTEGGENWIEVEKP